MQQRGGEQCPLQQSSVTAHQANPAATAASKGNEALLCETATTQPKLFLQMFPHWKFAFFIFCWLKVDVNRVKHLKEAPCGGIVPTTAASHRPCLLC